MTSPTPATVETFHSHREHDLWWRVYCAAITGILTDAENGDLPDTTIDRLAAGSASAAVARFRKQRVSFTAI